MVITGVDVSGADAESLIELAKDDEAAALAEDPVPLGTTIWRYRSALSTSVEDTTQMNARIRKVPLRKNCPLMTSFE